MPIYTKNTPRQDGQPFPSILAIGDSWFWYPANNILEALIRHPRLGDPYRAVQLFGYNGAHVADYVGKGQYADDFRAQLGQVNLQYYSAFLISGGGNDAVSFPDADKGPYHFGLKDDCSEITDPVACFDADRLDQLLGIVSGSIGTLIHDILWAVQRDFRSGKRTNDVNIFLHGYDYAVPDGRGANLGPLELAGPWLAKWMDPAKVDATLSFRKLVCDHLIKSLRDTLAAYDGAGDGRVHFVDSPGTLIATFAQNRYQADWANELHPSPSGFNKIVDRKWIPALKACNYAT